MHSCCLARATFQPPCHYVTVLEAKTTKPANGDVVSTPFDLGRSGKQPVTYPP